MEKEGVVKKKQFWAGEQDTKEEVGCKTGRGLKRLRLPVFAEESVRTDGQSWGRR